MAATSVERARAMDVADPLAPFRARFAVPDPGLVYLDGNSLGRPPLAAIEGVARVTRDEWPGDLIRGWDRWLDLPLAVGDRLATGVRRGPGGEGAAIASTTTK